MDDAERVPSQKVQDLAEAVVSLTLQVRRNFDIILNNSSKYEKNYFQSKID